MSTVEQSSRGERAVPGLAIDWRFECPTVRVTEWKCVVDARGVTPERVQPWHVIAFPYSGSYALHSRGRATLIDSTRIVFFNAMAPYQTSHPCGGGDRGSSLVIEEKTLSEILAAHGLPSAERPGRPFDDFDASSSARTFLLMRLLTARLRSGQATDALELEETCLRLADKAVGALALHSPERLRGQGLRRPAARRDLVEGVREILARGYRRHQKLGEIAREVGSSPFHLCRTFKNATGLPIHRYLNRLRLRASLAPLSCGSADLTALALELGYSSHSHFSESFQREFGIAPSQFRSLATSRRRRDLLAGVPLELSN